MTGKTLTERAVDGVAWQFIAVGGNFFLRGLILILLTRSLEASQFGIIAAATVILTIAERIGLIGVDRVLVQRLDLTDRYVSSAFAISLWSGCLLAILIYMGADLLAAWMNMPELAPFVRFLSVSLVLGSLAQVPAALLQRGLRFKALSIADIGSYLLGFGAVALPLAIAGYGTWSLAIGAMVQFGSRTMMLYALAKPALALLPQRQVIGNLVRPGAAFSVGSIGNYLATNIDNIIVGRILGADALGYYNRAYHAPTSS
jgi:O-antigen/teichoic acid export membrane protein